MQIFGASFFESVSPWVVLYLLGGLLASIPLLIWGYLFYKKDPERKDVIILSFSAGVMSVVPIFLVIGAMGTSPLKFGSFELPGLNVYKMLGDAVSHGGFEKLTAYIAVSILCFFAMYIVVGLVIFLLDLISGEQSIKSFEKILGRSVEAPLLFITLGTLIGGVAFLFDWSLEKVLYMNLLVGAVEEFAKHLVLRFSDENKFKTVADAIEFSIMVALGFSFLENIIYFVDYTWLSCDAGAINSGVCTFNGEIGRYVRNIGSVSTMGIFLGRSIMSTLTHIVASGIFGYFYGLANFAPDELKSYALRPKSLFTKFMAGMHRLLHVKSETLLREEKLLEGAIAAMFFHGMYNFFVDPDTQIYFSKFFPPDSVLLRLSTIGVALIMLICGLTYIFILLSRPQNHIVWSNKRVLEKKKKLEEVEERLTKQLSNK